MDENVACSGLYKWVWPRESVPTILFASTRGILQRQGVTNINIFTFATEGEGGGDDPNNISQRGAHVVSGPTAVKFKFEV